MTSLGSSNHEIQSLRIINGVYQKSFKIICKPIGFIDGVFITYEAGVEPAALYATTLISYSCPGLRLLIAYVLLGGISVPTVWEIYY